MTTQEVIGPWPSEFPVTGDRTVAKGHVVRSKSGEIEGRTTGGRQPCKTTECPGWFIGVLWETGQQMHICSEGWAYDPATQSVRVTAGGEVSARFVSPKPEGTPPSPRNEWPERDELLKKPSWKVPAIGSAG